MKNLLEMKKITKEFPGVKALDEVSFNVKQGEIHCLVGENGAGKSTLMKVLSGVYTHDQFDGQIFYENEKQMFKSINDSEAKGIAIIYQELALIPELSVYENVFLGHEIKKGRFIDWHETIKTTESFLKRVNLDVESETKVKDLGVGKQQLVEIAKALSKHVKLLILDEPTAALNEKESNNLLKLLKELKGHGVTSIMISHKLKEVLEIADTVTVLRDGKSVATLKKENDEIKNNVMVKHMVGREISDVYPKRKNQVIDEITFEVKNINTYNNRLRRQVVKDASFNVKKGEVVGLAGLMGAGRTEMAHSIFGNPKEYSVSGEVFLEGKSIPFKKTKNVIDRGLAYVSEDRKTDGLILRQDVKQNITLVNLRALVKKSGFINTNEEVNISNHYIKSMNIKTPSAEQKVENLSGGNQQKVSLSKWLYTNPKVLILDEPTRGIDVGAKYEIYTLINELIDRGMSIVFISSELPELISMSDRIYVMNEGKIEGCLTQQEATQEKIMELATR